MRTARLVAFLAALAFFVFQAFLVVQDGGSAVFVGGVVLLVPVVFVGIIGLILLGSRRSRRRQLGALLANRLGWQGVGVVMAVATDSPPGTPRPPQGSSALLFGPQGVELWTGARAPFERVLAAPWSEIRLAPARVAYLPGAAVTKAGIRLDTAWQPSRFLAVRPERQLRTRFPAPTPVDTVLTALHAVQSPAAEPLEG